MKVEEMFFDGKENAIVINGKRNRLDSLPSEGLAIVKKCADVKLSEIHSDKNKAKKTINNMVLVSALGVTAAMVANQYDAGSVANIVYSAVGIATSLAVVIKAVVATIKLKRALKKIKNHKDLDFALAVEFFERQKMGEDMRSANDILNEDDGRYAE